MTESTASEPIPAETLRTLAVAELTTIQNLLVYLDLDGLKSVRNRLHSPDLLRVCEEGPLAETRAVLLDTTCRALVAFRWAPEQYFLECGACSPARPTPSRTRTPCPCMAPPTVTTLTSCLEGGARWPQATPEDLTGLDDEPGDGWV
jgi:hypothetical protein